MITAKRAMARLTKTDAILLKLDRLLFLAFILCPIGVLVLTKHHWHLSILPCALLCTAQPTPNAQCSVFAVLSHPLHAPLPECVCERERVSERVNERESERVSE